jgi:hypothetical protein
MYDIDYEPPEIPATIRSAMVQVWAILREKGACSAEELKQDPQLKRMSQSLFKKALHLLELERGASTFDDLVMPGTRPETSSDRDGTDLL